VADVGLDLALNLTLQATTPFTGGVGGLPCFPALTMLVHSPAHVASIAGQYFFEELQGLADALNVPVRLVRVLPMSCYFSGGGINVCAVR
jgi:hypothetical protein